MKIYATIFSMFMAMAFSLSLHSQNGNYGPANFNDKIVPAANGFVMATRLTGSNMEIIKINNAASLMWRRTLSTAVPAPNAQPALTNLTQHWRGVAQAKSGFIVATLGLNTEPVVDRWEVCLIKTSTSGAIQWVKRYPVPGNVTGYVGEVIMTSDLGYLVTGTANGEMFALKTNSAGDQTWFETYSGGDIGWTAANYAGGGYLIAGNRHLWRLAPNGDVVSEQDIVLPNAPAGGGSYDFCERERIILLQTSGYGVLGTAISNGANTYTAIYYARFSWNNGQEFGKVYDETIFNAPNFNVVWISNAACVGNSLVMAYRDGFQATNTGPLRGIKTDFNGNIQGTANFNNTTAVYIGDFIIANLKWAFGNTSTNFEYNAYLRGAPVFTAPEPFENPSEIGSLPPGTTVKWVKPDGSIAENPCSATERAKMLLVKNGFDPATPATVAVFPNPATDWLTVNYDFPSGGQIRVFGMDGKLAKEQQVAAGENAVRVQVSNLEKGIWMLEIQNGEKVATQKFAKN